MRRKLRAQQRSKPRMRPRFKGRAKPVRARKSSRLRRILSKKRRLARTIRRKKIHGKNFRVRRKSRPLKRRRLLGLYKLTAKRARRLRERSAQFKLTLQQQPNERVIQTMHAVFRMKPSDFVWQLHEQLLHREPNPSEMEHYVTQLLRGTPKIAVASQIMQSGEAARLFSQQPPAGEASRLCATVAGMIQSFIHTDNAYFVMSAYCQLLSRYPDPDGCSGNMQMLSGGASRTAIIAGIFGSLESQKLLASQAAPPAITYPAGGKATHIGIFLGFQGKVSMSGEGIGRFSARLAEGLLVHSPDTVLYLATEEVNYAEAQSLTAPLAAAFPGRLFIIRIGSLDWINRNVPVDKWIVPYCGIAPALQLSKPIILCLHDMVYKHFPAEYYAVDPDFCNAVEIVTVPLAHKAAKVVFNSEFIRNHEGLRFLGLPAAKTRVIRLAPPSEEYGTLGVAEEGSFRNKYGLGTPYIVYPSAIRLHKNHDRLVEAFLQYRQSPAGKQSNLQLVLTDDLNYIVPHTEPRIKAIRAALNNCGDPDARNSVRFVGRVPAADLPSLYKYATGTIVPTLFEGSCPFPILESLLMDTPVAIGKLEVTREVIPAMAAFVTFDPYSVPEIIAAIHDLVVYNRSLLPLEKMAVSDALKRNWSDVAHEYYTLIKEG